MPLRINVITIFPDFFRGPLGLSIPSRAAAAGSVEYNLVDLRDFTHDKHRTVDDAPYGGGAGMVMKPQPFFEAVESLEHEAADRAAVATWPRILPRRRRAICGGRGADAAVRPLQGHRSARRGSSGDGGDLARRFRAERRGSRGAGDHRRDGEASPRRDVRSRQRARGFLLRPRHQRAELHATA